MPQTGGNLTKKLSKQLFTSIVLICPFMLFMVENDLTEAEKPTGTVREMNEKNLGSESHVSKGTPENHVMIDHERENERGTEGIVTKRKRGSGRELGIERSQRKVIGEVEAEIDHLTDGRVESQNTQKIVLPRWVHRIKNWHLIS